MKDIKQNKKKITLKINQTFKPKRSSSIYSFFKEIYQNKIPNEILKFFFILILILLLYFPIETEPNESSKTNAIQETNINQEIFSKQEIILNYPKFYIDEYKNIFDSLNKRNTLDIFVNKTKIENIFILIVIFPFLKEEHKIIFTKKNPIYDIKDKIFYINYKSDVITLKKKDMRYFTFKFKYLLEYQWEILPNRNQTNYIRHILYHYYPKRCLKTYEKSLNLNIKNYIGNNQNKLSYDTVTDLMSKI